MEGESLKNTTISIEAENKIISTKANTLKALNSLISHGKIEEMNIVTVGDYMRNKVNVTEGIKAQFKGEKIVVRSSSANEDCFTKSNAGHYTSVLDVDSASTNAIKQAIDEVIDSYRTDISDIDSEQVLIQHQAVDVVYSGVLFTHDVQEKRPYYLINYDDNGFTDSVTSGRGGKTLWIARNINVEELENAWKNLLVSVMEIERLLNNIPLDIEFAINSKDEVIIFQVRPLVAGATVHKPIDDSGFFRKIKSLKETYEEIKSVIDGQNMMLSDMAFWNPSEIIGTTPRPLDYSLYKNIITSRAWNQGLVSMGYRELKDDLMFQIGNKPYISLEYSFYTLIPSQIPEELALKLVRYYSDKLKADTTAHDKIEFEILFSSYDFGTGKAIRKLAEHGFSNEEIEMIEKALHELTYNTVRNHMKITARDMSDIQELGQI